MPVPAVEHGGCALHAHCAERQPSGRQGRDHGLVGELFAFLLGGELVAGRVIQDLRDLRGRGRLARLLHGHVNLAGHHDRGGEYLIADPLFGGGRFAGQGMLVDHRQPIDDDAVHRHDFAGVHDHDVALVQLVQRNLDFLAVHQQPDKAWLLTERAEQHLLRAVLSTAHQVAAERKAPAQDAPGEDLTGTKTSQYDDGIEHVDAEPPLFRHHPPGAFETGQCRVGEQRRGHRQQRRDRELRRSGKRQPGRAKGQLAIDLVELSGVLRRRQGRVEDLDELCGTDPSRVILDVHAALERIGVVAVDAEHAHQLAPDRLAQRAFAMQHRVGEPDGTDPLVLGAPSRDAPSIAAIAHHAVLVARSNGGGNLHGLPDLRTVAQDQVQPVQDPLSAVLPFVVSQIHGRLRGRRERCVFDRPQPQCGLQKAPAQGAVRLRKDFLAFDPDNARLGE